MATYKCLTCDLITWFSSTARSYKPPGKGCIPFLLLSVEHGHWDKNASQREAKNLFYEDLESKLIRRNSEYDLGSVLHLNIFHQNHVKINMNLNDPKKVCKTGIWYTYMYFPYILGTFRFEFFTDLINCLSETCFFPDIFQKKSEKCWEHFYKSENHGTCPTSWNSIFTLLPLSQISKTSRYFPKNQKITT